MSKPLYIFDLDGTLALIEHRRHFVENGNRRWPEFFKACVNDAPNKTVIDTMFRLALAGCECWVWSGRSDEVRDETVQWLKHHVGSGIILKMRKAGDHQPDDTLKASWLAEMVDEDRRRLVAIFDDRNRVVEMWRKNGITCFQVAHGNF